MRKDEIFTKDKNGNTVILKSIEVIEDVECIKDRMITTIDAQTESNIRLGFTFDGLVFSMSDNAQINWSNFPNLPSQVFPLTVMSKNDEEYTLSEANKMNFYLTALGYKNACLQAGNTKKKVVKACTTIEELNAL
jgi:hypothetical protein